MFPEPPVDAPHSLKPSIVRALEGIIGYKFKRPFYLAQVLVRGSTPVPDPSALNAVFRNRQTERCLFTKAQAAKDWDSSVMAYWISVRRNSSTPWHVCDHPASVTIRHIYEREPNLAPGSLTLLKVRLA